MSQQNISLIKNDLSKDQLEFYSKKDIIAVDCEMMGLNPNRDRLCLVQIGDANKNVVLVQIERGQKEAPNLQKLFESNETLKLFHYARTDVAFLKKWLDIKLKNVFCTKIGSKIARTYTDKHSYKELCKEIIGKDISKAQQSSDWGDAELNRDQKNYAAGDVLNLIPIYNKLVEMLKREERYELALQCCEFLPTICDLDNLGYQDVLEH